MLYAFFITEGSESHPVIDAPRASVKKIDKDRAGNADSPLQIITLGESTSAKQWNGKRSTDWSALLEQKLHEQGIRARVRNFALPATRSEFLVKRLEQEISYLHRNWGDQPQIVITMMGVNDGNSRWLRRRQEVSNPNILDKLRIIRMFRAVLDSNWRRRRNKILVTDPFSGKPDTIAQYQVLSPASSSYPLDIKTISKELVKNHGFFQAQGPYNYILEKSVPLAPKQQEALIAYLGLTGLRRSWKLQPEEHRLTYELLWNLLQRGRFRFAGVLEHFLFLATINRHTDRCRGALEIYKNEDLPISYVALGRAKACLLGRLPDGVDQKKWNSVLSHYGHSVDSLNEVNETRLNYQNLAKLLKENSVCLVVMQYPRRNIADLKSYFPDNDSPAPDVFVENKENFNQAVARHGWDAVFTDQFAGDFGHMTDLGHKLLADSALSAVLQIKDRCQTGRGHLTEIKTP